MENIRYMKGISVIYDLLVSLGVICAVKVNTLDMAAEWKDCGDSSGADSEFLTEYSGLSAA